MKAALNGMPSLSTLDGWWIEGYVEGLTGWSIGESWDPESNPSAEVASLYDKLESVILPIFYRRPRAYVEVMRATIALNGSFFNAQRMMVQYLKNAIRSLAKPDPPAPCSLFLLDLELDLRRPDTDHGDPLVGQNDLIGGDAKNPGAIACRGEIDACMHVFLR